MFSVVLLKENKLTPYHRVVVDFYLSCGDEMSLPTYQPINWHFHSVEEEIRYQMHFLKYSIRSVL